MLLKSILLCRKIIFMAAEIFSESYLRRHYTVNVCQRNSKVDQIHTTYYHMLYFTSFVCRVILKQWEQSFCVFSKIPKILFNFIVSTIHCIFLWNRRNRQKISIWNLWNVSYFHHHKNMFFIHKNSIDFFIDLPIFEVFQHRVVNVHPFWKNKIEQNFPSSSYARHYKKLTAECHERQYILSYILWNGNPFARRFRWINRVFSLVIKWKRNHGSCERLKQRIEILTQRRPVG